MTTIKEAVDYDMGFSKNSPDYELNIREKFKGYNLIIAFPTCPVKEERIIAFPAYVKTVADKFATTFSSKEV